MISVFLFFLCRRGCLVICKEAASFIPAGWSFLQHCEERYGYVAIFYDMAQQWDFKRKFLLIIAVDLYSVKNNTITGSSYLFNLPSKCIPCMFMVEVPCLFIIYFSDQIFNFLWKYIHVYLNFCQSNNVFIASHNPSRAGLLDGKHCTLPHLSGKTFVYNAAEERLELCVDTAGHFPVGPDVEDLVKEALVQLRCETTSRSREGSPSHGLLRLGSGGVVRKKEQLQNVTAFQGKGHSLGSAPPGSSPPEHKPITRQHSSGVDLSASVSRGPDLSDIPEDATKELVRMAPGFVTMKDSRHLDPDMIEEQRKKLQEMVSSIQASMDRHLREQQSIAAAPGGSVERTGGARIPAPQSGTANPELSSMDVSAANLQREVGAKPGGRDASSEELEEMDSQDAEPTNVMEPMDHS